MPPILQYIRPFNTVLVHFWEFGAPLFLPAKKKNICRGSRGSLTFDCWWNSQGGGGEERRREREINLSGKAELSPMMYAPGLPNPLSSSMEVIRAAGLDSGSSSGGLRTDWSGGPVSSSTCPLLEGTAWTKHQMTDRTSHPPWPGPGGISLT